MPVRCKLAASHLILAIQLLLAGIHDAGASSAADIDEAFLDEIMNEDCGRESSFSALSLVQTGATVHRRHKRATVLEMRVGGPVHKSVSLLQVDQQHSANDTYTAATQNITHLRANTSSARIKPFRRESLDDKNGSTDSVLYKNNHSNVDSSNSSNNSEISKANATRPSVSIVSQGSQRHLDSDQSSPSAADSQRHPDQNQSSPRTANRLGSHRHLGENQSSPSAANRFVRKETDQPGIDVFLLCNILQMVFLVTMLAMFSFTTFSCTLRHRPKAGTTRAVVEALTVWHAAEVEQRLPASWGYDCVLSRPLSSGGPVRLEVCIEGPLMGAPYHAPLTQRPCVIYAASASFQTHNEEIVRVASKSETSVFVVSVLDNPDMKIEIQGTDVLLFDISAGNLSTTQPLAKSASHWQDFVRNHPVPGGWMLVPDCGEESLQFNECALCSGATATLAGELHRSATGTLSMRPWQRTERRVPPRRWAAAALSRPRATLALDEADEEISKVLVTDDTTLLDTSGHDCRAACRQWWQSLIARVAGSTGSASDTKLLQKANNLRSEYSR